MKLGETLRNQTPLYTRVLMYLLMMVLIVSVFPREGKFQYEFRKGKPWMHENLVAPFDFAILKNPEEVEKEKAAVKMAALPYYRLDTTIRYTKQQTLGQQLDQLYPLEQENSLVETQNKLIHKVAFELADSIFGKGIISLVNSNKDPEHQGQIIVIRHNTASRKSLGDVMTIPQSFDYINKQLQANNLDGEEKLVKILENLPEPNLLYDAEFSKRDLDGQLATISGTRGMVQAGEKIINQGEVVNNESFMVLESLRRDYESQLGESSRFAFILAGQILLVAISISVLIFFLFFFRRDVFEDSKRTSLILLLIFMMVGSTSFLLRSNPDYIYVVPICLVPIIMRVFFDSRLALYVHIITIILIGFMVPNGFEFVFLQFIAGIISIFSVVNFQRRSQFVFSSMMVFIVYSLVYIGNFLIQEGTIQGMQTGKFAMFGASAFMILLAYPLIYIFEKTFGYVTDVTLLELSDTNTGLLRELARRAPGTFQHSLQVANLAEEVIQVIGGNPQLVRAGALYHDVGKMEMPIYFIENQVTGFNPHSELTYEESAAIITSHVIRGIKKAKKSHIPDQVIDFIRTHHGTRKTEYFYQLQKRDYPDEEIDESVFTYHGPIPFNKETCVLMMADSVEAASRSLVKPDEEKISALVESVINGQAQAGQFDNAAITLKDITLAKKILKNQLMHIYHIRIEYPG
ncbi:MAG TPA: hypothetical protein DEO70_06290 [Bacteroidales bacterium]|nr:MAG: hypothetical protein A2X11_08335 [Bacteroidetes bacterium GWE2_42_24]OFY30930.1 MAG: hypothetical protein A2X09_17110 [Bacteroidetes bacterium GWF2_43_11]HBZ66429.1 hypothetical protein [Bacteroidales bacterium]